MLVPLEEPIEGHVECKVMGGAARSEVNGSSMRIDMEYGILSFVTL
jgi:hypothetical protein